MKLSKIEDLKYAELVQKHSMDKDSIILLNGKHILRTVYVTHTVSIVV
jgi:hypothetical protein